MSDRTKTILDNYQQALDRIGLAAKAAGRNPDAVKLVVVTKGHPASTVRTLLEAGIVHFGENRVEEGVLKIMSIPDQSSVQWHMIGHVQSRKAGEVAKHFDVLHSLDTVKLAGRLDRFAAEATGKFPALLQFNVSGEASKFGWEAADENRWEGLLPEVEAVLAMQNLDIQGLMTMAPFSPDPEDARPAFVRLRKLRDFLAKRFPDTRWEELSMGMSADYTVGVQEGATLVRVGTAILGPPQPR